MTDTATTDTALQLNGVTGAVEHELLAGIDITRAETDVFVHEGGTTCGFAATAASGTEVGLVGPGGGGIPGKSPEKAGGQLCRPCRRGGDRYDRARQLSGGSAL